MLLHECHAEEHRRAMEWDLYWVDFYRKALAAGEKGKGKQ
jgi:hypothetical protein